MNSIEGMVFLFILFFIAIKKDKKLHQTSSIKKEIECEIDTTANEELSYFEAPYEKTYLDSYRKNKQYSVPQETIDYVMDTLDKSNYKKVFYIGYADKNLVIALKSMN